MFLNILGKIVSHEFQFFTALGVFIHKITVKPTCVSKSFGALDQGIN